MRKAILDAASALALASPAVARPICRYLAIAKVQAMSGKLTRTCTGVRRLSLSRNRLPSFPRPSWFAGLSS